ncbi:unnamed protein product [Pedinophyceae sp. YPF-701]|nr:unnamed protein product [Pedinophyceae sp. YPF-701]
MPAARSAQPSFSAYLSKEAYSPPSWIDGKVDLVPSERVRLGMLPTPMHQVTLPPGSLPDGCELWCKRDDLSGMQMSGNKVRKLEFLMAEALAQGADTIITIGGIQSNHCRATATAARLLGLDCHLILRTSRTVVDEDPGLVGNLLVERMIGAHVHTCTKEEYTSNGSEALTAALADRLRADGKRPYVVPVGGSNSLGTWGYIEAMAELEPAARAAGITDIAMACGSGATTAGIALGSRYSGLGAVVHGFGVCDSPRYFYDFIGGLLDGLGGEVGARKSEVESLFVAHQAKGGGYAMSTTEELETTVAFAEATGIVLDPVYSGKAMHGLLKMVREDAGAWEGRKILFWHTGGLLGMYEKADQLQPLIAGSGRWERMTT